MPVGGGHLVAGGRQDPGYRGKIAVVPTGGTGISDTGHSDGVGGVGPVAGEFLGPVGVTVRADPDQVELPVQPVHRGGVVPL